MGGFVWGEASFVRPVGPPNAEPCITPDNQNPQTLNETHLVDQPLREEEAADGQPRPGLRGLEGGARLGGRELLVVLFCVCGFEVLGVGLGPDLLLRRLHMARHVCWAHQ